MCMSVNTQKNMFLWRTSKEYCEFKSNWIREFDLKNYCNIIQMKTSKIYCNQFDTSQLIAIIMCKLYWPQYIPVVSTWLKTNKFIDIGVFFKKSLCLKHFILISNYYMLKVSKTLSEPAKGASTLILRFFKIGINSMHGWIATTRHEVTRKRSTKRLKHTVSLFKKNHEPTVKRCLLILGFFSFRQFRL